MPAALLSHNFVRRHRAVDDAPLVNVYDLSPVRARHITAITGDGDTGIIENIIDPAGLPDDLGDQRFHGRFVGNINDFDSCRFSRFNDAFVQRIQLLFVDVG